MLVVNMLLLLVFLIKKIHIVVLFVTDFYFLEFGFRLCPHYLLLMATPLCVGIFSLHCRLCRELSVASIIQTIAPVFVLFQILDLHFFNDF